MSDSTPSDPQTTATEPVAGQDVAGAGESAQEVIEVKRGSFGVIGT